MPEREYRLFLASPKDVEAERRAVVNVVTHFNKRYAGQASIDLITSDTDAQPSLERAQLSVFQDVEFHSIDVVVAILGSRMGTPTGAIDPDTGVEYPSGTAEEIAEARRLQKAGNLARVMVYLCNRPVDRAALTAEDQRQFDAVMSYRKKLVEERAFVGEFVETSEFELQLTNHLDEVIRGLHASPLSIVRQTSVAVPLCCDRVQQTEDFTVAFARGLRESPGTPQAYIVYGTREDRLDSLSSRLAGIVADVAKAGKRRITAHAEVELRGPPDVPQLAHNLRESWEFAVFGELDRDLTKAGTGKVALLAQTRAFRRGPVDLVVVEHQLQVRQWSSRLGDALKWYLDEYWGGYPRDGAHPTPVLLFSLRCSPSLMGAGIGPAADAGGGEGLGAMVAGLKTIADSTCVGCMRRLLPQPTLVTADEVLDWFDEHDVLDAQDEREDEVARIFGTRDFESAPPRRMAQLERELRAIYERYQESKLPKTRRAS
jgi:hypothetical protein